MTKLNQVEQSQYEVLIESVTEIGVKATSIFKAEPASHSRQLLPSLDNYINLVLIFLTLANVWGIIFTFV